MELYVSGYDRAEVDAGAQRARLAAEQVTREGQQVAFVRSIFVPDDETCFYLYEAESSAAVSEAARRAALRVERVAEAVSASASPKGVQQ